MGNISKDYSEEKMLELGHEERAQVCSKTEEDKEKAFQTEETA